MSKTAKVEESAKEEMVVIPQSRLQGLIDVVSLAACETPDPERHQIAVSQEDGFGVLEETFNLFIRELAESQRAKEEYFAKVESSQKEIEEKLATIERQRSAIRELSTPIIELWDDVLTLPIVGVVDTRRAVEMTEQLLSRIAQGRVRCVIIDITGVDVVDTSTADHFVKMTAAARLLGAYCIVTGISPVIAQTLVQVGVDFGEVRTLRNLKDGLKECFAYLRAMQGGDSHQAARERSSITAGRGLNRPQK